MSRWLLAAWCAALLPLSAGAAPLVKVEGVVSPAWIERADGAREPVAIDAAVGEKDRIATGQGARVLLRMGEGSAVKLGENAVFAVDQLAAEPRGSSSLWTGSLNVVRGAFRYSTGLVRELHAERDLKFRVNTLVAGIRGTDVWGKTDPARDLVVLIEGRITVTHGADEVTLAGQRSAYVAPSGGTAPRTTRISSDELKTLAAETEILAGGGGAVQGGRARVVVITTVDETYARDIHTRLRGQGYPAELRTLEDEDSPLYQVHLLHFAGEREARTVADRLRARGYTEARPAR